MKVIQGQCKKNSKKVEKDDLEKLIEFGVIDKMAALCNEPMGKYPSALALAHCQIDHENPLRLFVMYDGVVIINPIILQRGEEVAIMDGCYSYAYRDPKKVKRYNKLQVQFMKMDGKEEIMEVFGQMAHIFQHEIDHFNGKAIYC